MRLAIECYGYGKPDVTSNTSVRKQLFQVEVGLTGSVFDPKAHRGRGGQTPI